MHRGTENEIVTVPLVPSKPTSHELLSREREGISQMPKTWWMPLERMDDPDWNPTEEKEKKNIPCEQQEWIKTVLPAANRFGNSSDNIFHILRDLLVGNKVDMNDVFLSPSLIDTIHGVMHLKTSDDMVWFSSFKKVLFFLH